MFLLPEMKVEKNNLSRYRLERSKEDLDAAELLFRENQFRIANNRAYYSIFHALRSVLILDGYDSSKHSGIIAEFRRRYVKEGVFLRRCQKMIGSAFTIRNASDYDDMFIASKQETATQIQSARFVYDSVERYLASRLNESMS